MAGPSGQESAVKQPEKALRKVEASDEPKEIVCGGLRLRYAYFSQKGFYPDDPHKPNQDAYSITERFGNRESNDAFLLSTMGTEEMETCARSSPGTKFLGT